MPKFRHRLIQSLSFIWRLVSAVASGSPPLLLTPFSLPTSLPPFPPIGRWGYETLETRDHVSSVGRLSDTSWEPLFFF